jgi:serine protease Do
MLRKAIARLALLTLIPLVLSGLACQSNHIAKLEQELNRVADKAAPSVVAIRAVDPKTGEERLGGGVAINQNVILTTEALLGDASQITVMLQNGEQLDASQIEEICSDYETNICFIKLKRAVLQPVTCVKEDITTGTIGIVVGNSPYTKGLDVFYGTLAKSWLGGDDPYDYPLLTLHAYLGENSGGMPVFNHKGELIGIAEGRIESEHQVTFVLPAVTCQKVMQAMQENQGKIKRGWIGVFVGRPCPYGTVGEGVNKDSIQPNMIAQLDEGSLAAKAGLCAGDEIVACHGKEIKTGRDLRQIISMQMPGSKVEIMAVRQGQKFTTLVEVGEAPVHQSLRRCASRSI